MSSPSWGSTSVSPAPSPNQGGTSVSVGPPVSPNQGGTSVSVAPPSAEIGTFAAQPVYDAPVQQAPASGIADAVGTLQAKVAALDERLRRLEGRQ